MIIPENLAVHKPKSDLLKIINNKIFNDKVLFETESNFHNIKVVENEIGRFLHYNDTYQAGFIKTDFYSGNLPYINYFLLSYLTNRKMEKILLVGLGSGQIVKDLFKVFPDIKNFDIVDIEENILNIAKKYFNFKINDKTNFYLQDAFVFLRTNRTKYDLIIVDVANNEGIDERFIEQEYFNLIKKHLKNDGIFISNLCSSPDIHNKNNTFFKKINNIYSDNFNAVKYFIGNYSDKIYYKSFFNIDKRVIDITNLIIFSSNSKIEFNKEKINYLNKIFKNIDFYAIYNDLII